MKISLARKHIPELQVNGVECSRCIALTLKWDMVVEQGMKWQSLENNCSLSGKPPCATVWFGMNLPVRVARRLRELKPRSVIPEEQRSVTPEAHRQALTPGVQFSLIYSSSGFATGEEAISKTQKNCVGATRSKGFLSVFTCCFLFHLFCIYSRIPSRTETSSLVAKTHTEIIPVWWCNFF